jgi:proline dehydrogenase
VAVLDLQRHAQQVLQLAQECSSMWSSTQEENHHQLWQVHTWLLDFRLAGGQGLQDRLIQQQLQQCRAAWDEALRRSAKQRYTNFQRSVFAAVQRLPVNWQQPMALQAA